MGNRTTHFMKVGLVLVSLFCILVFAAQTFFMNLMRGDAIRQLGVIYISGLSEQIALHFGTTIELRLSQVEALVGDVLQMKVPCGLGLHIMHVLWNLNI